MKKVLFINSIVGSGSTGRIITGLMDVLQEKGIESVCAYGRNGAPDNYRTYRIGPDSDVYFHGAVSRITDRHGMYSIGATKKLIEFIRAEKPDMIHLHNVHGYYVNIRMLFKYLKDEYMKKPGRRIVWTLHDCWTFTGHCTHFAYIGCDRWKKEGCHNCPQKDQYPASLLMDSSKRNFKEKKELFTGIPEMELVTPSAWLKDMVSESFLKDYPVSVVPTGIDLKRFRYLDSDLRTRFGIGDRLLLLGVANPWRERKGIDDFMEMANRLGDSARIVMVGLKPGQMKNLPANVIGIGHTDSIEEMVEWYSTSDIYVNLTLEDTFPTTNLESMACGTPVVTYETGGSPESLTPDTGIVVPVRDMDGVINAINELKARDNKKTAMLCRERAEQYSAEVRFKEYLRTVYRV